MGAKYLLRFDDICPTMNWEVWSEIEECLLETGVKPILAVIPDNLDQKLVVGEAHSDFWERVRTWQSWGWTIGLHGYQHLYVTDNAGLVPINSYSEFAGLSPEEQSEKLDRGIEIFAKQGVRPEIWVAPAHSFDAVTVTALRERGIRLISDGFSVHPFQDVQGMTWIPQQIWRFRRMPFGVWTVCAHHNAWNRKQLLNFKESVRQYQASIIGVSEVRSCYGARAKNPADRAASSLWPYFLRLKRGFAASGKAGRS